MNACFISYRHPGNKYAQKIIESFRDALTGQIALFIPRARVYFDDNLKYGDFYNPELASQLCQSSCMVMLYNPFYFDLEHTYCAREYKAMVELEKTRLQLASHQFKNKSLIIPVVIRGEHSLPNEIKDHREYVTFDKQLLQPADFKKRPLMEKVYKIARAVYQRYCVCRHLGSALTKDCDGFQFPTENEIRPWLEEMVAMKPELYAPGLGGIT